MKEFSVSVNTMSDGIPIVYNYVRKKERKEEEKKKKKKKKRKKREEKAVY